MCVVLGGSALPLLAYHVYPFVTPLVHFLLHFLPNVAQRRLDWLLFGSLGWLVSGCIRGCGPGEIWKRPRRRNEWRWRKRGAGVCIKRGTRQDRHRGHWFFLVYGLLLFSCSIMLASFFWFFTLSRGKRGRATFVRCSRAKREKRNGPMAKEASVRGKQPRKHKSREYLVWE